MEIIKKKTHDAVEFTKKLAALAVVTGMVTSSALAGLTAREQTIKALYWVYMLAAAFTFGIAMWHLYRTLGEVKR